MRHFVVLLLALAGCKYLEQPKKVAELEKRLDEVSTVLSELTGEPVGQRPGAKADDEADHGKKSAKGKKAKPGKDAKSAKDDKDAKSAKDDKDAKDAKDEKVAKPAKGHGAGDEDAGEPDPEAEVAADPTDHTDHRPGSWRTADRAAAAAAAAAAESAAEPAAEPAKAAPDVHWGYAGELGPANWAELDPAFATCSKGAQQSPIDIMPRRSEAPEVIFVYKPSAATVVDTGHTLEVDLEPGSFIVVDGARFDLLQVHVHTPSEHTIAGDAFAMELHLVHRSKAGKTAVVAILFDEGLAAPALAPVWKGAPKAKGSTKLKRPFDPAALLPKEQAAYRYDGSLTVPPCTEGVIWEVMRRPRTEDPKTIAALRKRFGANARPVQELGDRTLR